MKLNWTELITAVTIYAVGSVGLLALTMVSSKGGHGNFMLPFALFGYSALSVLSGIGPKSTTTATKAVGFILLLAVSLATYAAHHFYPNHIDSPHSGPIGLALSLALIIPAKFILKSLFAKQDAG